MIVIVLKKEGTNIYIVQLKRLRLFLMAMSDLKKQSKKKKKKKTTKKKT